MLAGALARAGTPEVLTVAVFDFDSRDEAVRDLVMEAGYRTACTTDYGVNSPATSPLELRRIAVRHPSRSLKTLKARLMVALAQPEGERLNDKC